jgi:hypothetical protein
MHKYLLSLSINGQNIGAPGGVPTGGIDVGHNLLQAGVTIALLIAVSLAIIFIIYSGIQWAISGGDKQKLQQARSRLIFAIIGLLVVVAAFFIVRVVLTIIGTTPGLFF